MESFLFWFPWSGLATTAVIVKLYCVEHRATHIFIQVAEHLYHTSGVGGIGMEPREHLVAVDAVVGLFGW